MNRILLSIRKMLPGLVLFLLALPGCEGPTGPAGSTGPAGPQGPPGEGIAASVHHFSTTSDQINLFLGLGVVVIPMPEITPEIVQSGKVLVFRGRNSNDTSEWLALPFTEPVDVNSNKVLSYYYGYEDGELNLYFHTDFTTTQWPSLNTFIYQWKVIIME